MKESSLYLPSNTISDFGYFHLADNFFRLKSLDSIRSNFPRKHFDQAMKAIGVDSNVVPVEIELPSRPSGEINFEEVGLSLAEITGAAALIKTVYGKEVIYYGYTYLGRIGSRWFDRIDYPEAPRSDRDNWIVKARGIEKLTKLDLSPSLIYRTSNSLFEDYKVLVTKEKFISTKLNNLVIDFTDKSTEIKKTTGLISRQDLHLLVGFLKSLYLFSVSNLLRSPSVSLINKPLEPFSTLEGEAWVENLLEFDQIKSFV